MAIRRGPCGCSSATYSTRASPCCTAGDFDAAGLAICGRMQLLGVAPWRMGSVDYADAHAAAERDGLSLFRDPRTGLVSDAVRVRLIEIGEAVKATDPRRLAAEPSVPWRDIAGIRDHLANRRFDTDHAIVATVEHDLPPLVAAVLRALGPLVRRLRPTIERPDESTGLR